MTALHFENLTENVGTEIIGLDMCQPLEADVRRQLERGLGVRSVLGLLV